MKNTSTSQVDNNQVNQDPSPHPHRWKALGVLSLAQFLIILDTSIIGVALPTIQQHFSFSQADLQWIFNAYVIVFGALLLLGGRLSDIIGQKKIFVIGFATLTIASVIAGLAPSGIVLIIARALQGIGAALIAPSALSMVVSLFGNNKLEMNKAMGIWGASAPAGGTAGVFLGGIITAWVDWSWVFLINVPIGLAVLALTPKLLPKGAKQKGKIDYTGALSITGALVLLVYAIVTANDIGWMSVQTISMLGIAGLMFALFLTIQRLKKEPLVPLSIFRVPNLLASNIAMALLGASWIPMWFFLNLYLQQVLNYGPFESGLALLPMTIMIMVLMISTTPKLMSRFGIKRNLVVGLGLLAAGIAMFTLTPSNSSNSENGNTTYTFMLYVLPASLIAALGMSLAYIPVLTAAISNAHKEQTGLASGLVNTSYQIGSALGLAIIVAISSNQTETLENIGLPSIEALNGGFHTAFILGAIISVIATAIAVIGLKMGTKKTEKTAAIN
ncbi:MAG TPA: MFS transporter [Nitrososphaeraceae archaeon]|nr:MFS transporter [Nitrososphaeraceae archaeon]